MKIRNRDPPPINTRVHLYFIWPRPNYNWFNWFLSVNVHTTCSPVSPEWAKLWQIFVMIFGWNPLIAIRLRQSNAKHSPGDWLDYNEIIIFFQKASSQLPNHFWNDSLKRNFRNFYPIFFWLVGCHVTRSSQSAASFTFLHNITMSEWRYFTQN